MNSFLLRYYLSVRMRIHIYQNQRRNVLEFKQIFWNKVKAKFKEAKKYEFIRRNILVSRNKTAIYFEIEPKCTVHPAESNKVSISGAEINKKGFRECIAVTSVGINLSILKEWSFSPQNISRHVYIVLYRMMFMVAVWPQHGLFKAV